MRRRITANFLKAFLLVGFLVALAGGLGWLIGGERSAALFAFCAPQRRDRRLLAR